MHNIKSDEIYGYINKATEMGANKLCPGCNEISQLSLESTQAVKRSRSQERLE